MLTWVLSVCCAAVCCYAALCYRWRVARRCLGKLPTFSRLPVLGNLHLVFGDGRRLFRLLEKMSGVLNATGLPSVVWLGPHPILFVSEPDDVKAITNFVEKPYYYSFARIWLGDGLITAPTHVWKKNIKKLGGTFSTSVVEGFLEAFNTHSQNMVQKLKGYVGKEPFDVSHEIALTTLQSICHTALGEECVSDDVITREYYNTIYRCLQLIVNRTLNVFLHPDFIYKLTPAHRELFQCKSYLQNFTNVVIKKRKRELKDKRKQENQNNEDFNGVKMKTYLDILLKLHESDPTFTEEQIRAEVDTIIAAGQETAASALTFALLILGRNKCVQNKLYAELKEIFGDSTRPVEKEDLARMKYCEAVAYETLRLYPSIPGFLRCTDKDTQLKSCRVPSKTTCVISVWAAGRSRRVWGPDAEEFKPERWLHVEPPPGYPTSFFVFGLGRKPCIGKKYAMTIMKTMLANCIRELEFESECDFNDLRLDVVLRAVSGHLVKVRLRK